MSEKMCLTLIDNQFKPSARKRHACRDDSIDISSICAIVSAVKLWSTPLSVYFDRVTKFGMQTIGSQMEPDESQIPLIIALYAMKKNAVEFIRPLYRYFPLNIFEYSPALLFTLWTAKHCPENLLKLPETIKSRMFWSKECFAVILILYTSDNLEYVGDFISQVGKTILYDESLDFLYRQLYRHSVQYKYLSLAKFFIGRNPNVAFAMDDHPPLFDAINLKPQDSAAMEIMQFVYDCNPADINRRNASGETAVTLAISANNVEALKFLIQKGTTQLHSPDFEGQLPLHLATICEHLEMAKLILSDAMTGLHEMSNGLTPMHYAAMNGSISFLDMFLDIDPTLSNVKSWNMEITPMDAATERGHLEAVKYLRSKGATISSYGLQCAVYYQNVEMCETLISFGSNVGVFTEDGWNALLCGAEKGNVKIGKMLLDAGADVDCFDSGNWTPLHLAAHFGHFEFVELLMDYGSKSLNAVTKSNHTPVNIASYNGFYEIAKYFLEKGAEVDIEDIDGDTALTNSVAADCSKSSTKVLQLLLDYGAKMDHVTKTGDNVFHRCVEKGTCDTLEFLIKQVGSELPQYLSKRNDKGQTPYDICMSNIDEENNWEQSVKMQYCLN